MRIGILGPLMVTRARWVVCMLKHGVWCLKGFVIMKAPDGLLDVTEHALWREQLWTFVPF